MLRQRYVNFGGKFLGVAIYKVLVVSCFFEVDPIAIGSFFCRGFTDLFFEKHIRISRIECLYSLHNS